MPRNLDKPKRILSFAFSIFADNYACVSPTVESIVEVHISASTRILGSRQPELLNDDQMMLPLLAWSEAELTSTRIASTVQPRGQVVGPQRSSRLLPTKAISARAQKMMVSGEKSELGEDELSFSTRMRTHESKARHRAPGLLLAFVAVLCVLASPAGPIGSWSSVLATVASILHTSPSTLPHVRGTQSTTATNLTSNGRTTDVLWDKYSLVVKGQRVFIQ